MAEKLLKLIQGKIDLNESTKLEISKLPSTCDYATATGRWLDNLNILIGGTARTYSIGGIPAYSDQELRTRMAVKIEINNNGGTYDTMIKAYKYYLLLTENNTWSSVEPLKVDMTIQNCNVFIYVDVTLGSDKSKCGEVVQFIPAGVGFYLIEYSYDAFQIYNEDGVTIDNIHGFSDVIESTVGGKMSELLYQNQGAY